MRDDVIITGFSNPTGEGVTIHLNKASKLKTGMGHFKEFWISWDKIGAALIGGYTDKQEVSELNKLRNPKSSATVVNLSIKDILGCPFCGSTPKYSEGLHHSGGGNWGAYITCESKKCYVNPQFCFVVNSSSKKNECKIEIIKRWNQRP